MINAGKKVNTLGFLLAFAAYIILALIFYRHIFDKIYISPSGDTYFSFYSWNTFFRHCIVNRIFPLWNPLVLCGQPYHLESIGNFSLPNALLLFLNVNTAWNVKLFLSSVLSGWLMFFLLRRQMLLSNAAAFIGGLIFMFLSADIIDNPLYFLPLLFIFANKWLETGRFTWIFALAVSVAAYIFNANPQYVIYASFFVYMYMFLRSIKKRNVLSVALISALPFFIAVGLSSLRIFPMLEMLSLSHRASMGSTSYALPLTHIITLVYPKFYLGSLHPEFNFFPNEILNAAASFFAGPERVYFIDGPYAGILPLVLAISVFLKKKKNFLEKFFIFTSLAILLYAVLNPFMWVATRYLPLVNKMPLISRIYIIYGFSVSILAAFGIDYLFDRKTPESKNLAGMVKVFSVFLILLVIFKVIVYAVLVLFGPRILSLLSKDVLPLILKEAYFKASPEFYYNRLQQFFIFLQSWTSLSNRYFLIPTAIFVSVLLFLSAVLKNRINKLLFVCLAGGIIVADLALNFDVEAVSPAELAPPLKAADFIDRQSGIFRVMPLLQDYDMKNPAAMNVRTFLRPESNMIYGIMTPEGYRSLYPDRYADIVELLTGQSASTFKWRIGEFDKIDEDIADLLNIKYVVTYKNKELKGGYRPVYEDDIYRIFLNEDVLPRAFLAHSVKLAKSRQESLALLKSGMDFKETVILEDYVGDFETAKGKSHTGEEAIIEKYEPNRIYIKTKSPKGGFLVLLDSYHPGWKSYVDGSPSPIFIADYIFRAVYVPAGEHHVEFSYRPDSLRIGALVSLFFLCGGIILCFLIKRRI